MSNTGSALLNSRELRARGDIKGGTFWAQKAYRHIREDMIMPDHFGYAADHETGEMIIECELCEESCRPATLATVARFRDQHFYCGTRFVSARGCGCCGRMIMAWEKSCRGCNGHKSGGVSEHLLQEILSQTTTYIVSRDWVEIARIQCNTLVQAKVAAEAMLPMENVIISRA